MPRGIAISENFGDLLDARFSKIYQTEYEENLTSSIAPLFNVISINKGADYRVSGIGGLSDVDDFDGTISYDSPSQLYDKTITFPEKAKGIKVERKLYDDDLYGIMDQRPRGLAAAVARTRLKSEVSIFNNAFTSADGGDAVALCSSSHPYSPDDPTTQDNSGTSALSAVSVEATRRIGANQIFNDRGELALVNYDTLLVPVNLEETGYEIINSSGKVDTAENNVNFHKGKYMMITCPRLSDSNNWFFIDSRLAKQFLYWVDRIKPEFAYDRDFDTLVAKWSVYMRYGTGFADWRWCYGQNVA
jgi:hypothetical protein